jgi:pimeloyl-ACP methyl ester carboxylesterase
MLKWIRNAAALLLVLVVVGGSVGVVFEQLKRRALGREFPPIGQMVEFDGRRSHLYCLGQGSPTVVLEAGLDISGSQAWKTVQPRIAKDTRVCSYDRAGILWSEPRPEPRDAKRIAEELHGLLTAASVASPYVMVGHSLGGLLVRVYKQQFPGDVAGIVLVDSSHPEQFERYPPVVQRIVAIADSARPSRLATKFMMNSGLRRMRLSWKRVRPPTNAVQAYVWRSVPEGYYGELAARDTMSRQAAEVTSFGDRPLIVLTAGKVAPMPGVPDSIPAALYRSWVTLQDELAELSTNSVHRIIEASTHYIQNDAPDAVVQAIGEVVESVRHGVPLGDGGS